MNNAPPNFREMYEQQKDEADSWRNEAMFLKMSLRDQFAMAALTGMLSNPSRQMPPDDSFELWSDDAYKMADAMLKTREEVH